MKQLLLEFLKRFLYRKISDGNGGEKESFSWVTAVGIPVLVVALGFVATEVTSKALNTMSRIAQAPAKADKACADAEGALKRANEVADQNKEDHKEINRKLEKITDILLDQRGR